LVVMEQVLLSSLESLAFQIILLYLPQAFSYHSQPSFDNEQNLPWHELQHYFSVPPHVLLSQRVAPLSDAAFLPEIHGVASLAVHALQLLLQRQFYASRLQSVSPRSELVSFLQRLSLFQQQQQLELVSVPQRPQQQPGLLVDVFRQQFRQCLDPWELAPQELREKVSVRCLVHFQKGRIIHH